MVNSGREKQNAPLGSRLVRYTRTATEHLVEKVEPLHMLFLEVEFRKSEKLSDCGDPREPDNWSDQESFY